MQYTQECLLGVAGGLVSVAFTRLLLGMRERFLHLSQKTLWFQPVTGGLLVGLLGWFVPQVLGVVTQPFRNEPAVRAFLEHE